MEIAELVFIPTPGAGHLAPMVEFAKTLISRTHRWSVAIFIMELPFKSKSKLNSYIQTLLQNEPPPRIRFVNLILDESKAEKLRSMPSGSRFTELVQINKSRVKEFYSCSAKHLPTAFVVDMLCTAFTDVANELRVPTYVFFTSNACFLSLEFYLQSIQDDHNQDISAFKDSYTELSVPGFANPVPSTVLPYAAFDKENGWSAVFFDVPRQLRKAKGILVNTYAELESYTLKCLSEDNTLPPIYTIGPVLNFNTGDSNDENEHVHQKAIITWLDSQPQDSVVYLCFGSMGTFGAEQVAEIARSLEQCGHRFIWSVQQPKDIIEVSIHDYLNNVLPEGFLDRTNEIGKVIGWAPQIAVLSHPAVGGFVSHCGWNSIMESLWCGVPMAAWPLYSEQQMNAFEMIKELEVAFEIKIDYRMEDPVLLIASEIERGIKQLMDEGSETRKKLREMSKQSRKAVVEGGSSYAAVGHFIDNVTNIMFRGAIAK